MPMDGITGASSRPRIPAAEPGSVCRPLAYGKRDVARTPEIKHQPDRVCARPRRPSTLGRDRRPEVLAIDLGIDVAAADDSHDRSIDTTQTELRGVERHRGDPQGTRRLD